MCNLYVFILFASHSSTHRRSNTTITVMAATVHTGADGFYRASTWESCTKCGAKSWAIVSALAIVSAMMLGLFIFIRVNRRNPNGLIRPFILFSRLAHDCPPKSRSFLGVILNHVSRMHSPKLLELYKWGFELRKFCGYRFIQTFTVMLRK